MRQWERYFIFSEDELILSGEKEAMYSIRSPYHPMGEVKNKGLIGSSEARCNTCL